MSTLCMMGQDGLDHAMACLLVGLGPKFMACCGLLPFFFALGLKKKVKTGHKLGLTKGWVSSNGP